IHARLSCRVCGHEFYCEAQLQLHFNRRHRAQDEYTMPFQCQECGKRFYTKGEMSAHKVVHNDRNHECEVCGQSYKCEAALVAHMHIHSLPEDYAHVQGVRKGLLVSLLPLRPQEEEAQVNRLTAIK
ncbi:hypothetical protein PENTCL1PPCAC_13674, partial [Pristionchus entomophagus]